MSVIYQTVINTGKLHIHTRRLSSYLSPCKCSSIRRYSDNAKKFITFEDLMHRRRAEARRSVVVQVNSESSFNELYGYCSKFGDINGIHHYNNVHGEHFMLVEFSSEENLKDVLQKCAAHQRVLDVMALQSPFVWFRADFGKKEQKNKEQSVIPKDTELATRDGNTLPNGLTLYTDLQNCSSLSEQIQLLYDRTVLNDIGVRLRYMVARELEVVLSSLYANIAVKPFGSSVNGYGKMGCDLDLVLTNDVTDDMCDPSKRLVYHGKKSVGGRGPWQRHMELVAEILELCVPGAARVTRILNARVPIVKYAHEYTNVECDLCYNNVSGVYMSELLWQLGSLDPRVRPLVFAVRRWAEAAALTNQSPGRWITNFPLTLMVIFFLQQERILPSFKALIRHAGKEDVRIAENGINCTFLRDLNNLPLSEITPNTDSLEQQLIKFFEFYAQFDFNEKAISVLEGCSVRKPNNQPLYIVNPLQPSLNVSKNVNFEECERIRVEVRNAAWQLETHSDTTKPADWGLMGLIETESIRKIRKLIKVGSSHRLVSVKDLFTEKAESEPNNFRDKIDKITSEWDSDDVEESVKVMRSEMIERKSSSVSPKIKYKNTTVANAVRRIRREKMS